ncbi:hypothetical protein GE21DRAFT_6353 [Neurospora crassa]|uniref:Uncharacterized protein n=1 Tax=Neurospora crassa (strain ATCC 24698 / 74-OR23-1A / CBS 708.71 / DSM 1257 / FGSC 987) TaxID=367110 RepID=Q7SA36_NEUCR|nr:hypothetical protein NCU07327 [Neurospora crassa OR74A]EAA33249.2 hypothetical protein NCU07327 [Neurospora crassa OR74A]KHE88759.1 hypothetical protein GE21DRAFT_6353 [Neurospora crassa]|eukprot:XP_962485.2 hypothetical protein NCU07327 [Neurospora crassa OR74A]
MPSTMPSQRPFFLSTFFAAFRQQPPSSLYNGQQPNKNATATAPGGATAQANPTNSAGTVATPRTITTSSSNQASSSSSPPGREGGVMGQLPLSPRSNHSGIPIPEGNRHHRHHHHNSRRRGSDSSSEGFREVSGAEKLYIGGRTATGEEKFFKLGVVRRIRSGDRLSLDRLSL